MRKRLDPPLPGARRWERKFAWFPKQAVLTDPYGRDQDLSRWIVWFEDYYELQEWDGAKWVLVRNEVNNQIFY